MFHVRNRSKTTLNVAVKFAQWQMIHDIDRGYSAKPFERLIKAESDLSVLMPSARLFTHSDKTAEARLVIDFWSEGENRVTMEVAIAVDLVGFPDRQGLDKLVGIVAFPVAKYRLAATE